MSGKDIRNGDLYVKRMNTLKIKSIDPQCNGQSKGFKAGDRVFIVAKTNLAGKSELDDVESIQILP